jgi:hypothetical protein
MGRTYQLWLGSIALGNRISGGLLAVDAQGAGTLRVPPPRATWAADIFGVTMERQGGAREPSDELVLVGELTKQTGPASPPVSAPAPATEPKSETQSGSPATTAAEPRPAAPTMTASLTPQPSVRGPDGQLVRVVPVAAERTLTVAKSALKSLGWDIEQVDEATGVIRTEPRNMNFKDFGVYAGGMRHSLDVVVRPISSTQTSISVRREVFEERRIFWSKERKVLPTPETAVEDNLLDVIERLL